jgi:transposase
VLIMEDVLVIRRRVLVDGVSVRRVAQEMGLSRNTVRRYVEGAQPGPGRPRGKVGKPVSDSVGPRALEILGDAPRWTGGKQRLTAKRLHSILVGEGKVASATLVKRIVREWKRRKQEVFVPLVYRAGDLAQVDFFEVLVDLDGERRKAHMFLMRLMHSGRDFAWLYPRQDQTCFLDGHVRAFAHFGAVPQRIAYDNLKAAVAKILVGSERELSPRFLALTTHYLHEACFARPRTGHDKGGVESRGKGVRWQELVPIPSGTSLAQISGELLSRLDARAQTERDHDGKCIQDRFADELPQMLPLAPTPFDPAAFRPAAVTRRSLVQLEGALYSVWSTWAGLDVKAYIGVDHVVLTGPDGQRVEHPRQRFGGRSVDYRHYLRELARKPQALRQVAAELIGALGAPFDAVWRRLVDEHGPKQAARHFAQVLKAVEERGERHVVALLAKALETGEPVALALRPAVPQEPQLAAAVLPTSLAGISVGAGSAADYDTLLGGAE